MFLKLSFTLLLISLLITSLCNNSLAEFYTWEDDNGYHATDNINDVPEKHRPNRIMFSSDNTKPKINKEDIKNKYKNNIGIRDIKTGMTCDEIKLLEDSQMYISKDCYLAIINIKGKSIEFKLILDDGKLAFISSSFRQSEFNDIKDAINEKYGNHTYLTTNKYSNVYGNKQEGPEYEWKLTNGNIFLSYLSEKYSFSSVYISSKDFYDKQIKKEINNSHKPGF